MKNLIDLSGKVVLITGAGGGIGSATAEVISSVGGTVALTDIAVKNLEDTVEKVKKAGGEVEAFPGDITDYTSVKSVVEKVVKRLGRIDVLLNVAGGSVTQRFLEQTPEQWEHEIALNLFGTIYCTRAVLDAGMFERKSGAIVSVASDAGRVGSLGESVYAAAKGGVVAFTKSMAREMSRHGIRVNCISPGPTDTFQTRQGFEKAPKVMEKMVSLIAMKRIGTPYEQANVLAFLASDAASYVTGQVLSVNGGLQMV